MQHDTASFIMGDVSEIYPHHSHHSPRLSSSPTITEHHPHPSLDIHSNQDSYTQVDPPTCRLPETQLSGDQSQPASPNSRPSSVGTPTSLDLATEERLTCTFSQSPLAQSPPAEPQSSLAADPTCRTSPEERRQRGDSPVFADRLPIATSLALGQWTHVISSPSSTSSESSSPSETDEEDMPVSLPPQPMFWRPTNSKTNSPRQRTLPKAPVG